MKKFCDFLDAFVSKEYLSHSFIYKISNIVRCPTGDETVSYCFLFPTGDETDETLINVDTVCLPPVFLGEIFEDG